VTELAVLQTALSRPASQNQKMSNKPAAFDTTLSRPMLGGFSLRDNCCDEAIYT
jgi:hypothetical protein